MLSDKIGLAQFGKFDGFEIKQLQGNLHAFQGSEAQQTLVQALQLRLEDFRIYDEADIWGFSLIHHQYDQYRCFSLYRYALDIYRRDGYQAVSMVIKNGILPAPTIHHTLHSLIQLPSSSPFQLSNSWEQEYMPAPPLPHQVSHLPAFIPLHNGRDKAVIQFWREMLTLSTMPYRYFLASHGVRTLESLELGKCFLYRPQPVIEDQGREGMGKVEYPDTSLVHAFDQGEVARWKKAEGASPSHHKAKKSPKKWWQNLF